MAFNLFLAGYLLRTSLVELERGNKKSALFSAAIVIGLVAVTAVQHD